MGEIRFILVFHFWLTVYWITVSTQLKRAGYRCTSVNNTREKCTG